MDYQEEQRNELEAIESIYSNELQGMYDVLPFPRGGEDSEKCILIAYIHMTSNLSITFM